MTVLISMLRGVNVGGHNKIAMDALRKLYESLKLRDAQTYVQSGNVVFRTDARDFTQLGTRIENEIQKRFGFRPAVILRTCSELRDVIARNPFTGCDDVHAAKLLVTFLAADPGQEARDRVIQIKIGPEELRISGREHYVYFPNGQGQSKLPVAAIERALKTPGTGRNWNTVTKLLEIAEKLEESR